MQVDLPLNDTSIPSEALVVVLIEVVLQAPVPYGTPLQSTHASVPSHTKHLSQLPPARHVMTPRMCVVKRLPGHCGVKNVLLQYSLPLMMSTQVLHSISAGVLCHIEELVIILVPLVHSNPTPSLA